LWPVVVGKEDIIWMRGFAVAKKYRVKGDGPAILITERPIAVNS
jgi:hypothetical protein